MPGHARTRPRCIGDVLRMQDAALGEAAEESEKIRAPLAANKAPRSWFPVAGLTRVLSKSRQFRNHWLWRANMQQRAANLRSTWAALRRGFTAAKLEWRRVKLAPGTGAWLVDIRVPGEEYEWLTVAHVSAPFPRRPPGVDPPPVLVENEAVYTFPNGHVLDVERWLREPERSANTC